MRVAILPSGALLADTAPGDDEASDGLSVAARDRVARAFARGPGHALLDLGATELDASLAPPLAFLRDLGRAFVTRLCAVPDLEERRERVEVDCPPGERDRVAGAVPPMDGGEYVDADWVAARWADLNRAFAEEIRAHRGSVGDWLSARHPSWRPGWSCVCPTGGARGARRGPRSPCAWARRSRAQSAWTRCSTSRSPSRWATKSSRRPRCASSWPRRTGWYGCAGNGSNWTASGCAKCSPTGSGSGARPRRAGSRSSRACGCSRAPPGRTTGPWRWRRARGGR